MNIVVINNDGSGEELFPATIPAGFTVAYRDTIDAGSASADCYIDLLFEPSEERIHQLQQLQPALIIVNAVSITLDELPAGFVRMNGWPTFLKRDSWEASCSDNKSKEKMQTLLAAIGKKVEWVADTPGFVTARVVSMIINEAYHALAENVSSKEAIDTAMKLGTNYPYGPFEWGEKIGLKKVYQLLTTLTAIKKSYEPSALLKQEALQA